MKKIMIFGSILLALSSCYYDNKEELYGLECNLDNITYSADLEQVIQSSCATSGCHDGSTQYPNYSTYQSILQDTGIIFERSIVQKNMPPGSSLSDCNFKLLQAWIEQGAKE